MSPLRLFEGREPGAGRLAAICAALGLGFYVAPPGGPTASSQMLRREARSLAAQAERFERLAARLERQTREEAAAAFEEELCRLELEVKRLRAQIGRVAEDRDGLHEVLRDLIRAVYEATGEDCPDLETAAGAQVAYSHVRRRIGRRPAGVPSS